MVNAGDLNKADGDVLYAADISKLIDMKAKQFKQTSQLIYNTAYTGFDTKTSVELDNIKYDVFNSDTATTKTNFTYDSVHKLYVPTITTNQASSDTLHNPNNVSNTSNAFDMNDSTSASSSGWSSSGTRYLGTTFSSKYVGMIKIKASASMSGGGGIQTTKIILETYDGSTWTNIYTLATGTKSTSYDGFYYLNSTTQGIRIGIQCAWNGEVGTPTGASYLWDTITYGTSDSTSGPLIFQTTSLPTIKDCIPTWNAEIDGNNTLTVSISADGTNYETVTDASYHKFTNTGTNLYVKFEVDRVDTSAIDKINSYSVWYNCGVTP